MINEQYELVVWKILMGFGIVWGVMVTALLGLIIATWINELFICQ